MTASPGRSDSATDDLRTDERIARSDERTAGDRPADRLRDGAGEGESPDRSDDECSLCGLPTPLEPIADPDVEGTFCCRGCLEVQRTLGDAPAEGESIREALDADGNAIEDAEGETAFLAVSGMHCHTCELFLEGRATRVEGIEAAQASYATDAVRVVYDPDRLDPDALPDALSGAGYDARNREEGAPSDGDDVARFLLGGGFFGMMVMLWYALFLYPTYLGFAPLVELGGLDGLYLFANLWVMTSVVLFYAGYPILRGAYVSLRAGAPNMDLLVAVAATSAYAYSTLAMLLGETHLYFDVTVAIVVAVTAGNYYEGQIKRRATGMLSDLREIGVDEATRADGETVSIDEVDPGDRLLVRPGDRVPLDGTIEEGTAAIDESLVTGEAVPVEKGVDDPVLGGTVVTDAPIVVRVGEGAESTLDRIVDAFWGIQSARPGVQRLADRLATIFVPLVLVLGVATTIGTVALGAAPTTALLAGLTVLIVSCPCALGLATPLAIAAGVGEAAERGIVVASTAIFEDAPDADVVVFDKTGTLTTGSMTVSAIESIDGVDPDDLLRTAGAVEALSEHPIAAAIADAAAEAEPDSEDEADSVSEPKGVGDFERHRRGVAGVVDDRSVLVGHPDLLRERGWDLPEAIGESVDRLRAAGEVPVVVGWDGRARGVIAVGDAPRPEWEAVVETLSRDREVVVLTGDEGAAADRFGEVDGVSDVIAGVPPEGKAETVSRLRSRGTVAMVGDGSNDAPALAAADVGIAMGGGTALAIDAADAAIVGDDLEAVPETFAIASATNRRIKQNLGWAFLYNGVAIPLAVAGLLNPLFAAAAMAASSLLVVVNSAR